MTSDQQIKFFDSHAHLDHGNFADDQQAVIERAKTAGIEKIISVATQLDSSRKVIELVQGISGLYATVGISPHDAKTFDHQSIRELRELTNDRKVVAIGEVGLDYHYKFSSVEEQRKAFIVQIRLAQETSLPLIMHLREADDDFFEILKSEGLPGPGGVIHCFTGNHETLERALELGLYISFSGIVTFKKSMDLRGLIASVPSEQLLIETDAPYLAPQAHRGKRCEPAMVIDTAKVVADATGLDLKDIARITSLNANRLFEMPYRNQPRLVYTIRDSAYINLTNLCSNSCYFCHRIEENWEVKGYNLKLDHEPSVEEVWEDFIPLAEDYRDVVFCGYGEPTMRFPEMLELASRIRFNFPNTKIRLNTNGQGNLINEEDIVPHLVGKIDQVSISLNTTDVEQYQEMCQSKFGSEAWTAMIQFAENCRDAGMETNFTVVTCPEVDIEKCRYLSEETGIPLRLRKYQDVG